MGARRNAGRLRLGLFSRDDPRFSRDLTAALIAEGKLAGIIANRHASGTAVIADYGEEHLRTLKPICYTSADSVLQIAAHEEAFGLDRLYDLCRIARRLCDPLNIGRVIARPFIGASAKDFVRTANRKDFAVSPPDGNLLQRAARAGRAVVSIGKIGDIFAHRDTGDERKGKSNDGNVALFIDALTTTADGGLMFVNLVDFDTEWGHRRDVPGYAACLEAFDARLGAIEAAMRPQEFCVITADHGNDPTFRGFDHTREHVPILASAPALPPGRSARAQASPTSPRRSRSNSACRAERTGRPGQHELRPGRDARVAMRSSSATWRSRRVLLMNDARWPWLILVPRREGPVELVDLDPADRTRLIEEAARAAGFLKGQAGRGQDQPRRARQRRPPVSSARRGPPAGDPAGRGRSGARRAGGLYLEGTRRRDRRGEKESRS